MDFAGEVRYSKEGKYRCEFCGKKVKYVAPTSMTGCYCLDCLELTIEECQRQSLK